MKIEEIIQIARDRKEIDFLFNITKIVAETDSIGEGYTYCSKYTKDMFNDAQKHIEPQEYKQRGFKDKYCQWLEYGGIPIYEEYLKLVYEEYLNMVGSIKKKN
jgi:hypothetical protein